MSLRDHLQAIYDQHGQLTPELVMEQARPEDHPLHGYVFDRPPDEAAEAWYRHRAHELIRSVKVVYREATETEPRRLGRAYHAVQRDGSYVYEPAEEVARDPMATQMVLRDMEREWTALRRRYEGFDEFWRMIRKEAGGEAA